MPNIFWVFFLPIYFLVLYLDGKKFNENLKRERMLGDFCVHCGTKGDPGTKCTQCGADIRG